MELPEWVTGVARAGYRRAPRWAQRPIARLRRRMLPRTDLPGRPALSVVMPVYNVERYLKQAVASVLAQSFRDLELILVDDGSTDASGRLCDALAEGDSRVRVIHKANAGLGAARNTGTAAARGEYLAFIDSDDYVLPGAYAAMMRSLRHSDSDVITGNVVRLDGRRYTQSWNQSRSHLFNAAATTLDASPELVFDTVAWNKVYRREFWDVHVKGFPVGKLYEDIVPVFKAFVHARSVDVLSRTVYVWRRRDEGDSITQRLLDPKNVTDRFEAVDEVDELIRQHGLRPAVAERFRFKILEGDLWIYVRALDGATERTLDRIREAVERYWTTAPRSIADKIPAERRVAYWLIAQDRAADVPAFLDWFWTGGRYQALQHTDGGRTLNPSAGRVRLDGIPEHYLRVGSAARSSLAARLARTGYHRLPHRVRRPAVRARRGLIRQVQSSRGHLGRLRSQLGERPLPHSRSNREVGRAQRPALIDAVACTADGEIDVALSLPGNSDLEVGIAPAFAAPRCWVAAERIGDRYRARVPTVYKDLGGTARPLPSGPYRLCIRTIGADGLASDVAVRVDGAVRLPRTALTENAKVTAALRDHELRIEIAAPVADDVLARPAQAALIARYGASPRALEDAVFFQVDVGAGSADSALALADELRRRGSPLAMYWGVEDLSVPVPDGVVPIVKRSEAWYARLNTSRYVVNNYGGFWGLTKDPGQRYLQTWHGTPLKYIGVAEARLNGAAEARLQNIAKEAAEWDAAVSPSPYFTRILRSELLFSGRVLEVGYPRNDRLARATAEDRNALRAALGIDPTATVLLYAPTYREGRRRGWRAPLYEGLDLSRLLSRLGPDWCVLLRGHSFNARNDLTDRTFGQVIDVTRHNDINDLYLASDALLTDYSSVMFDYAVTGKPMAFFVPDLDHYAAVRGLYLDLAEIAPGPVCGDIADLADHLAKLDRVKQAYADRYADFRQQFAPWDDGNAAARVVDEFFTS